MQPQATKTTPFSRNLKGIFFFLVVLIVVSQISPLLLLNGLIDQEEKRADGRLNEAMTFLREAWTRTDARLRDGGVEFSEIVDGHGLRRLTFAAFLSDSGQSEWHYRTYEPRQAHARRWDSLSVNAPRFAPLSAEFDESRQLTISDVWASTPVQARLIVATPITAALKRQFRTEMWLRGVVMSSFVLFTLLFYKLVLLPFHDMRKRAAALVESGVVPPAPGGDDKDPEYVMATFDTLVHRLTKQAGQMEQRAIHSEQHARDVERFNEYILTSMTTGMIIFDQHGQILRFNRAAEQILHLPAGAMIGRHYTESGLPQNLIEIFAAGLLHGEVVSRHELRVEREGSEPVYLGINTSCIKSDKDETVGLSVLLTDLTAIKKLQDEVAENQRLADLGELAAGLAHQLRNSMAAILGYGRLLRKSAPDEGQLGDWAEGLLSETTETSDMITRFLDFARPLQTERHPIDLADCVEAAVHAVETKAHEAGVMIDCPQSPAEPMAAVGDDLLLKQVLVNLLQNAIEASSSGTHVAISARGINAGSNARWIIAIVDEGCGIPPENQSRIFQPFFTTKDTGTGLGLALARKIMVAHGGGLTLSHSSPAGSTFLVTLPATCETTSHPQSEFHPTISA